MSFIKQYEIAEHIGISESALSRVISGKRKTPPEVAKQLSILTSSDIETWLFNDQKNIAIRKNLIKKISPEEMEDLATEVCIA